MMNFTEPTVKESINKLSFYWDDLDLRVIADKIDDKGKAELWFYHCNGRGDQLLHTTSVNLLSTPTMKQLVGRMETHSKDAPWQQCLTFIAKTSMEYQRKGEPGCILQPTLGGELLHPGYYIEPFLLKGLPNLIHGGKGANKTTICLAMLGILSLGADDLPIGIAANQSAKVGLLDWENDRNTTHYNISSLVNGGTVPYFEIAYLRCSLPLTEDIQRIADWVSDNQLDVVLIDSLGQAAGSDQFDTAGKRSALRFFEALRQLKVTSLIIGQEAKNQEGNKSIYGSVYYQYYSRNIFELKAVKDPLNKNILHLALFHTDSNYSGLYDPMGFYTTYEPGKTIIKSEPVKLSQFLEKANQLNQLYKFLESGSKSIAEVAQALNTSVNAARVLLTEAKGKGRVNNFERGMWGLVSNFTDEELIN